MDRRLGNTTPNSNSIYNPTTTAAPHHSLQYPSALVPAEKLSIQNLITGIPAHDAQALLDELEGAIKKPGTIRTSKVAYFKGLVDWHRSGGFVPAAGIQIATRRNRQAASEEGAPASTPLSRAECHVRLQEIKAKLALSGRM
ncbi:hypothetical protein [Cupriavidus sp. AU9028]|uniref:hypothetical protein n=1 Tax=Cupriavidus sp. AU9028 TaxID=2871157 RepID=UPI001C95622C|nr:hypothetical protein [Cupriavidus sp. AU9028]MBY4897221.1 hypothetical protein [Cupriavidus sp. AU9028]